MTQRIPILVTVLVLLLLALSPGKAWAKPDVYIDIKHIAGERNVIIAGNTYHLDSPEAAAEFVKQLELLIGARFDQLDQSLLEAKQERDQILKQLREQGGAPPPWLLKERDRLRDEVRSLEAEINTKNHQLRAFTERVGKTPEAAQTELDRLRVQQEELQEEIRKLKTQLGETDPKGQKLLTKAEEAFENREFDQYQNLIDAFVERKLELAKKLEGLAKQQKQEAAEALYASAQDLHNRLDWSGALEKMRRAAQLAPKNVNTLWLLGIYADDMGYYDEAVKAYQSTLAMLPQDAPATVAASLHNNLGVAYENKGEYDHAIQWYQKALEARLEHLGPQHPSTGATYCNLGVAYEGKSQYAKSLEYHKKDLAICQASLGEDHPWTKIAERNVAGVKAKLQEE